jgi:phosphoserine phosphatase
MKLTLFDLDHTLLSGDSDVLWCEFLIREGALDSDSFAARNADMEARYQAGTVGVEEFADFYLGTLTGRTPEDLEALRQTFLVDWIVPRIPASAVDLVSRHLDARELVVMTTATNRFITELTALYFGIEHLIATEPQVVGGLFTGRSTGVLNMREGKVRRLHDWLRVRGHQLKGLQEHRLQRLHQRPAPALGSRSCRGGGSGRTSAQGIAGAVVGDSAACALKHRMRGAWSRSATLSRFHGDVCIEFGTN